VWVPLIPRSAVTVFSGGTDGVLSPHVTIVVRSKSTTGLRAGVGCTRILEPHEIGTSGHALEVCSSIHSILKNSGVTKDQVRLILIKCPLLTSEKLEMINAAGKSAVTTDTYESMTKSRYASALGIAIALEEVEDNHLDEAMRNGSRWSTKASCSSGAELEDCHILIIASDTSPSDLRAVSGYMNDAIDARAITRILEQIENEGGHVQQVFAKAEANPSGNIRRNRHTMNTDSDIHSTRHARAAVGGLLAGLVGETRLYVHQAVALYAWYIGWRHRRKTGTSRLKQLI
jgi:cyanuric acid amidohydrolase